MPSEMLSDEHYADQLVERMGWALVDAEQLEQAIHRPRRDRCQVEGLVH